MRHVAALTVSLVAALGLAAGAAAADGEPKRAITKADQARAKAVLLRKSDLGPAFVARPHGDDKLPEGVRCDALAEDDLTVSGDAASPDFQLQATGVLLTAGSTVQVYRTLADANASWKRGASKATPICLADIVRKSAGPKDTITIESSKRITFPKVAAKTMAFRVVASIKRGTATIRVYFDAIVMQQGRIQTGLVLTSAGRPVGAADQLALASVVASRLEKAAGGTTGSVPVA